MFYILHRSQLRLVSTSQYGRGSKIPHMPQETDQAIQNRLPLLPLTSLFASQTWYGHGCYLHGVPPINNSPRSQAIHRYQHTEQRSSELPTRHGATLTPLRNP